MRFLPSWPALALAFILGLGDGSASGAAVALGPAALRTEHSNLAPELASSGLRAQLVVKSREVEHGVEGDLYAVLSQPFAAVSAALADPVQWCDILILHLNNKQCRPGKAGAATVLELRVGKTYKEPAQKASVLRFDWQPPELGPEYLRTQMVAAAGPMDTQDYRLIAEAVPLDGKRTFLHLAYSMGYGTAGGAGLNLYFKTTGRDKVGFSAAGAAGAGPPYVAGIRGLMERNTMRYFLAIDAYLQALSASPNERLQRRMEAWFDGTEKYPRQLHEMERAEYLSMKRNEVQAQPVAR